MIGLIALLIAGYDPVPPIPVYTKAGLPACNGKRQFARLSDYNKGVWECNGTNWNPLNGDLVFNVVDFGADPTGTVDSSTAINSAIVATNPSLTQPVFWDVGFKVVLPPGTYKLSASIDVNRAIILTSSSPSGGVILQPDAGVTAIIVHYTNDAETLGGVMPINNPDGGDGTGSRLERLLIKATGISHWTSSTTTSIGTLRIPTTSFGGSQYYFKATSCVSDCQTGSSEPSWTTAENDLISGPTGTTITDNHVTWTVFFEAGIWLRAEAIMDHIWVDNVPGDSFLVMASSDRSPVTAASFSVGTNLFSESSNGDGWFIGGFDVGRTRWDQINSSFAKLWGIWDDSIYGGVYTDCQTGGGSLGGIRATTGYNSPPMAQFIGCYNESNAQANIIDNPAQQYGGTTDVGAGSAFTLVGKIAKNGMTFNSSNTNPTNTTQIGGYGNFNIMSMANCPSHNCSAGDILYTQYGQVGTGWFGYSLNGSGTIAAMGDTTSSASGHWWFPTGFNIGGVSTNIGPFVTGDSGPPTSGAHRQSDIVTNVFAPDAASPFGWRASAAGTPGTWAPEYGVQVPGTELLTDTGSTDEHWLADDILPNTFNVSTNWTSRVGSYVLSTLFPNVVALPPAYHQAVATTSSGTNWGTTTTVTGITPGGGMTVEAIANFTSAGISSSSITSITDPSNTKTSWLFTVLSGQITLTIRNEASGNYLTCTTGTVLTAGNTYHIAGVLDDSVHAIYVYVNGAQQCMSSTTSGSIMSYSNSSQTVGYSSFGLRLFELTRAQIAYSADTISQHTASFAALYLPGVSFHTLTAETSNYTLTSKDSGQTWTNTGASGEVDFTLPTCTTTPVYFYRFRTGAAQILKVIASGTDVVYAGTAVTASGGNIQSSAIGTSYDLECSVSGKWMMTGMMGTISVN